ncbi:PPOX class F420-dependent oxidoreductase [Saccharothrix algeriensis]|uniref:PPOX class F420-dependent oxidoreductase n=1 Tax=Saccharothrix algeriensis TaxID=173560 RepID=A0A8T8I550_9PSEU|nr:PPOX class F420-dependent oxidoreductase [Saccharothrix algeriensis]MBM7811800.1 PPOX class probable F420-dependent enzyme [Saccharothrix algeriensis]QTR05540.1 PPOX class F420-dependent oxidoreductase [Saccharothrix algeriensis]
MAITLNPAVRALVDGRNYATISTLNPDGSPQSSVMWITRDGDDLIFSTLRDRRKERNLRRDPRASVSVWSSENPEVYAEIRGTVTITDDTGHAVVDALSHKYLGKPYPEEDPALVRVVLRLTPTKVTGHAA